MSCLGDPSGGYPLRAKIGAAEGAFKMSNYPETVKEAMVRKLTTPGAPSARVLAQEVEITQSTLSRWVREYAKLGKAGGVMKNRRPQDWTAEEKLVAVLEYEKLDDQERGIYLREKGLHSVHIEGWKKQILEGLKSSKSGKKDPRDTRIKELEKELGRKEKALAEAAALLVLKKKVQDIWGYGEEQR
jgi:transposase